jgi:hypothetical protein
VSVALNDSGTDCAHKLDWDGAYGLWGRWGVCFAFAGCCILAHMQDILLFIELARQLAYETKA